MRVSGRAAAAILLLLSAGPAHAWSGDLHRSIVEGALRVSPAAAARIPDAHRENVLRACLGSDASERLADPGAEAEQFLKVLLARPPGKFSYNDALALGRLLHDVAHAAVPPDARLTGPNPEEIFSGREIGVFRDPAPRAASLAEALRASRRDCSFATSREEDLGGKYRSAIQATVDALLRLPALREPRADSGLDVFIVADRVDNGKSGPREVGKKEKVSWEKDRSGVTWEITETTTFYDMSQAGKGQFVRKAYETKGVRILEWTSRADGPITRNRLLVLNNTQECFPTLRITENGAHREVPLGLPPHAVARIEFETPTATPREKIRLSPRPGRCAPGTNLAGSAVASRLFGVPATVTVGPRWEEAFHAPFPDEGKERPIGMKEPPPPGP